MTDTIAIGKILVTGAAGFIGFHLTKRLLNDGYQVYGIDNLNDYYDVNLKQARLLQLQGHDRFEFQQMDLSDRTAMLTLFETQQFEAVVNLAAQAGVRYSLENPWAYIDSNVTGFVNLLEGCRKQPIKHLVFASSSSVYGANIKVPFATSDTVDYPVSLYAATKKSNELMAHTYSHLYGIPTTGLRFFTVYGEWGRPDMAYFKFVKAITEDKSIDVYNFGDMSRDFTYIDDIIEGVVRVLQNPPSQLATDLNTNACYRIYNIGNHNPVKLTDFISAIETTLGQTAKKRFLPMQPGDVPCTYADVDDLFQDVGFKPTTDIQTGIQKFVDWYLNYYNASFTLPPCQTIAVA
ncbi:NAD-dependent epimerase [Alkalinema sp. FACHB-956]|nr:NAD-dependent epimerase [Alkalinema sp. FACHB-956]